jgi:hypothetical protein
MEILGRHLDELREGTIFIYSKGSNRGALSILPRLAKIAITTGDINLRGYTIPHLDCTYLLPDFGYDSTKFMPEDPRNRDLIGAS